MCIRDSYYTLEKSGNVQIIVYDEAGNEVETIVEGFRSPGKYIIGFDAKNLASGIYYFRIISGSNVQTKKMVLLK